MKENKYFTRNSLPIMILLMSVWLNSRLFSAFRGFQLMVQFFIKVQKPLLTSPKSPLIRIDYMYYMYVIFEPLVNIIRVMFTLTHL